jgi:hypothetical protein
MAESVRIGVGRHGKGTALTDSTDVTGSPRIRIAVFSGVGFSAESGVPTFRDDVTEAASLGRGGRPQGRAPGGGGAVNYTDVTVITQNVDDLHEWAGSHPVHHLHDSLAESLQRRLPELLPHR